MASRRKAAPKARTYVAPPFVGKSFDSAAIAAHHDAVAAAPWLAGMATLALPAAPSPRLRVLCVLDGVEADHKVLDHFEDEALRFEDEAYRLEDEVDCAGKNDRRAALYEAVNAAHRQRTVAEMELRARLVFSDLDIDLTDKDEPIDDVDGMVKVGGKWAKVADYDLVFLDNETASVRYLAAAAELPPTRVAFVANVKAERRDARDRHVIPATLTAILRRVGDLVADRRRQLVLPWGTEIAYPPTPSPDDSAVDEAIVRFAQA